MDSFELNKLIGAFLAAVFVVFTIGLVSDAIFHEEVPETAGYAIEAAEEGEGAAIAEEETVTPIGQLMANANVEAGESVFKKCASCHTADQGGANKVGPNLYGVVGRAVASHEGFSYTEAMRAHAQEIGGNWDFASLSAFLIAPKKVVPGTSMGFAGLKKDQDRADLLAWLNQQSDSPQPLPEPEPEPAADEGGTDVEGAAPPEGTAGKGDVQPQAEGASAAEGTGDVSGAMPAANTTEAAPSSEAGEINVAPTAVEGTGEPISSDEADSAGEGRPATEDTTNEGPAGDDASTGSPTETDAATSEEESPAIDEETLPEEQND